MQPLIRKAYISAVRAQRCECPPTHNSYAHSEHTSMSYQHLSPPTGGTHQKSSSNLSAEFEQTPEQAQLKTTAMAKIEPHLKAIAEDAPARKILTDEALPAISADPTAIISEEFGHFAEMQIVQTLYEASSVDGINVSVGDGYWSWGTDAVRPGRAQGKIKKFQSKSKGIVMIK